MHLAKQKRFRLNLAELHAVCEANYARLLKLFPAYETSNSRVFEVGSSQVTIEVVERCRYTTFFRITETALPSSGASEPEALSDQQVDRALWLGSIRAELRAYHDATMVEVQSFGPHKRILARYDYPNESMYQQDEKCQQNRFLADWLEHCLEVGRSNYALRHDTLGC